MSKPPFAAHTPPDDAPERWHPLEVHLKAVADTAARFGASFGAKDACRAVGLAHDLGKANPKFQEYLASCHSGRPAHSAPHAAPSAKAAYPALQALALAVMGHHAGLHDPADFKRLMGDADRDATIAAESFMNARPDFPRSVIQPPAWANSPLECEFFIRMCFSALVDADFLDTEGHFSPLKLQQRSTHPPLNWYCHHLQAAMKLKTDEASCKVSHVNDARRKVLKSCYERAGGAQGAYRLTVPTGGGKTLAGLTFALQHGVKHELTRIIVAIPYTSIIDQTVQEYGRIFGKENVLEHHSAHETENDSEQLSERELRRRLAAENWDCPLVVTTTVQLFESLLANRTSRCRKLHNIVGSVIILDEVQTLPVPLLPPILDVLGQLVKHYGCTVLFCTATQPDFSGLGNSMLSGAEEIVEKPSRFFETLRRVEFERLENPISEEALAALVDAETQVLCILNSRPDAVRVIKACRPGEDLLHLSTLMCPHHRKEVLDTVRFRLKVGLPVRLVSTQVVEAGVDLDFPVVMRDLGPLDRIVQAAGRCNREGQLQGLGRCVIFSLKDAKAPKGAYSTGIELTRTIVEEQAERLDQPDVLAGYFRDLYKYAGAKDGPGASIQGWRERLHFKTVAEKFRLIEDDTVSVVVTEYDEKRLNKILEWGRTQPGRLLNRRMAPLSVSVRNYHFRRFQAEGLLRQHALGPWLYDGPYNEVFGIGTGAEWDPADLIADGKAEV